jgi:hypothetical protein
MWYYEFNHQPVGPVSQEAIAELLATGKINALTLVWQEGMPDWKHLGETALAALSRTAVPMAPTPIAAAPMPANQGVNPNYYAPVAPVTRRVRVEKLQTLFTWWAVMLGLMMIYEVCAGLLPTSTVLSVIACFAEIVIITFVVLQFILLYRLWQIDQDGFASTTPGKAVGFLFIPIFQIYWIFRAYFGLGLDQNRYIARHFDPIPGLTVRKAHPIIAFIYLVGSLLGGIAMYTVIFSNAFSSIMAQTFDATTLNSVMAQYSIPLMVFTLFGGIVGFLMFNDFYQTAKNILETETKQQ